MSNDLEKRVEKLEIVVGLILQEVREKLGMVKGMTLEHIKSLKEQEEMISNIKNIVVNEEG